LLGEHATIHEEETVISRPFFAFITIALFASPFASGCSKEQEPVARNAAEAWPDRSTQPAPLASIEIQEGCKAFAACRPLDAEGRSLTESACVDQIRWNAERMIPISTSDLLAPLRDADERPEFFIRCVRKAAGDCAQIAACLTARTAKYLCEEDGCIQTAESEVTCQLGPNADVAVMKQPGGEIFRRDCARSFTVCDPSSPTGCTDRHSTKCDPDQTKGDRCDGAIRLGCDGSDRVSYHDCARLGGTCGALPTGGQGCVYTPDM
jgi:hypothetical protein